MRGRILPKKSYKLDEALELEKQGKLMEFIPPRSMRMFAVREYPKIGTGSRKALRTWRDHFESQGIPYIITVVKCDDEWHGIAMYKERRIEDGRGHRIR